MSRPRAHRKALKVEQIKSAVEAARKKRPEKDEFLWDGLEHGLGVKVTPAGSGVFILQKSVSGRLKRITLGNFGDMTLDGARVEARKLNGLIAAGRDPVAEKRTAKEDEERRVRLEKTVADLWQRYELEVIAGSKPNSASTAREKRRMWRSRIEPAIGKLKVKDVTGSEVGEIVRAPLQTKNGRVRGKGEAGNLYRLLRSMFYKAILWGVRPRELGNPLKEVEEPQVKRRERLFGGKEIGSLLKTLERGAKDGERPQIVAAIKASVLTGARISELLTLEWDDIRDSELHLRDTKTGGSIRPISADALKLLKSVERMPGSPYVFRAVTSPAEPLGYDVVRKAFNRIAKRAGLRKCSLHTVRHWFATMTANSVSNPRVGMKLTGHKSHAAYMNYIHAEDEQAHALAGQLAKLTRGLAAAPSNVVPSTRKVTQIRRKAS